MFIEAHRPHPLLGSFCVVSVDVEAARLEASQIPFEGGTRLDRIYSFTKCLTWIYTPIFDDFHPLPHEAHLNSDAALQKYVLIGEVDYYRHIYDKRLLHDGNFFEIPT